MEVEVSVIIPTYNRPESVLRTLESLCDQSLSGDAFEVIVVDDGSGYDPTRVTGRAFPFAWQYLRKPNEGATIARNHGVESSQGRVLVFIDDDVTVSRRSLEVLARACRQGDRVLAMGTLPSRVTGKATPFTEDAVMQANARLKTAAAGGVDEFVHFSECNTQLLAVSRADFYALGMLQDPTGGWPNWDDVDFGYRAHMAGYRLLRCVEAVGEHWDYSLASLDAACQRWRRASKSAVRLFAVHPGLQAHIPMLHDKTPIRWRQDSGGLIVRKLARHITATPPVLRGMEMSVRLLERWYPSRGLLRPLYRWISGSYMFVGYQEGLREERRLAM